MQIDNENGYKAACKTDIRPCSSIAMQYAAILHLLKKIRRITGVGIAHRRDTEYLKSIPNESGNNNLGNLPSVSPDIHG